MSRSGMRRAIAVLACAVAAAPVAQATTVHGRVTDVRNGAPIASAEIAILETGAGEIFADFYAGADGSYTWTGTCESEAPPADCIVRATADRYIDASVAFDPAAADVASDLALEPRPVVSISGQVRSASSGTPIVSETIELDELRGPDWTFCTNIESDASGRFVFEAPPGTYRVCAGGVWAGYVTQCFDGFDRGARYDAQQQTPITLADGETHPNTDFSLRDGGVISGTLHDGYANVPLAGANASLTLYDIDGHVFDSASFTTDDAGHYRISGIPDGAFYLFFDGGLEFADRDQIYPDIVCDDFECPNVTTGDPVAVTDGAETTGIDFTLNPSVVIGGRVADANDGAPIASGHVTFYRWASFIGWLGTAHATTDASGRYSLYVQAGSLIGGVQAAAPYIGVVFPNVPCLNSDCVGLGAISTFSAGDRITNFDFALDHGAAISGTITDAIHGGPSSLASIELYDASYTRIWYGTTDADGHYETAAWVPGTFYLEASSYGWFACAFYEDRPCPTDGDPSSVDPTPIVVALDEVREIDIALFADAIFAGGFEF